MALQNVLHNITIPFEGKCSTVKYCAAFNMYLGMESIKIPVNVILSPSVCIRIVSAIAPLKIGFVSVISFNPKIFLPSIVSIISQSISRGSQHRVAYVAL